jgi:hypothetical protein
MTKTRLDSGYPDMMNNNEPPREPAEKNMGKDKHGKKDNNKSKDHRFDATK